MPKLRMRVTALVGDRLRPAGSVVEVPDEKRARHLVAIGHAEHFVELPEAPQPQKAADPKPGAERAVARK